MFLVWVSVILVAVAVIFGDLPILKRTPIHQVRVAVLKSVNPISRRYARINGLYFEGRLTYILGYQIPIAHLLFVTTCLYMFKLYTFPMLNASMALTTGILFSSLAVYLSTIIAVMSDPGAVANNSNLRCIFPNNQLIFFDGNTCKTCKLAKPGRSKHCSHCDKCFLLFDHHCLWINNCVAYYNFKWFLLYLVCHIQFLVFGVIMCDRALHSQVSSRWGYFRVMKHTNYANRVTGAFLSICAIFSVVVALFAGLHVYYLYLGVTTNEVPKWGDIEYLVNIKTLYRVENSKIRGEMYVERENSLPEAAYLSLKDESVLFLERERPKYVLTPIKSTEDDLINIYDRGFWNNVKERVFNTAIA